MLCYINLFYIYNESESKIKLTLQLNQRIKQVFRILKKKLYIFQMSR